MSILGLVVSGVFWWWGILLLEFEVEVLLLLWIGVGWGKVRVFWGGFPCALRVGSFCSWGDGLLVVRVGLGLLRVLEFWGFRIRVLGIGASVGVFVDNSALVELGVGFPS